MKKIIKYEIFESAAKLITLYHGGNLDYFDYTIKPTTTKRAEFGPGLYLTSKEEVARSYAKGYSSYLQTYTNLYILLDMNKVYLIYILLNHLIDVKSNKSTHISK